MAGAGRAGGRLAGAAARAGRWFAQALDERAGRTSPRVAAAAALAAAAVAGAAWLAPFVASPGTVPPGGDLAWYSWRSALLTAAPPAAVVTADGPLQVFGGGYRVAVPILGALLRETAGMDGTTVSVLLVAGRQVLVALALGAVAYRWRRDPLLFALVVLFAAGFLFIRPFIGYVDNVLALLLAAAALWFAAGQGWPARVGVFLAVLLAFFAHPPVAAIAASVLVGAVALRVLLERGIVGALREQGWIAAAAAGGAGAAWVAWRAGVWGPGRRFADAFHVAPYSSEFFLEAVPGQLWAVGPGRLVPLMAVGVAALVVPWRRFSRAALPKAIVLWLAPLLGLLGFALDLTFPFKRSITATLAPALLAGIGLWALARLVLAVGDRRRAGALAALGVVALAAVVLVPTWRHARVQYRDMRPWAEPELREAMAAASAYLRSQPPGRPTVFVAAGSPRWSEERIWGEVWRADWSLVRAGLPGDRIPDTHLFFGAAEDLLAGRPTVTGNRMLDLVSRAGWESLGPAVAGREPVVLMMRPLNLHLGNPAFLAPPRAVPLGGELALLQGPGLASVDPEGAAAAREAALEAGRSLERPPGLLDRPGRLAGAGIVLALVVVVPGALAAPWFGVRDVPSGLGMVPVVSLCFVLAWGIVVLGVGGRPLTAGVGWVILALAAAIGAALRLASAGRPPDHTASETRSAEQEPANVAT